MRFTSRALAILTAAGIACAGIVSATPAQAASPCQADCISKATVTPYPDGVAVSATTTVGTVVKADVYFGATKVKSFGEPASANYTTTHAIALNAGLKQRTWYTVVVRATDNYGSTRSESYLVRTPFRSTSVAWGNVYLKDDGDYTSAGDLMFGTMVGASKFFDNRYGASKDSATKPLQWSSGSTHASPLSGATILGATSPMPLKYTIIDDDEDDLNSNFLIDCWNTLGVPWHSNTPAQYAFGTGSDQCADWATAATTVNLPVAIGTTKQTVSLASPFDKDPEFSLGAVTVTSVVSNVPGAPVKATAEPFNQSARVTWAAPTDLGGSPLTRYVATASTGQQCAAPAGATSCTVSGLSNGTAVTFTVVAENSEGASAEARTGAVTPFAVPTTPVITKAVAGDGRITVTLAPPAAGSPAPATYCVTYTGLPGCVLIASNPVVLTGLTNGTSYTLRVRAGNNLGYSDYSAATSALTPASPSTITGWSVAPETALAGTQYPTSFSVNTAGAPRPVAIQYRRVGTTTWLTHVTTNSNALGTVSASLIVKQGINEWRAYAPLSGTLAAVASGSRVLTAATTISGFNYTAVSAKLGTVIADAITVAPGPLRTVTVQYRAQGAGSWVNYAALAADLSGNVTVSMKVLAGKYEWRVYVAAGSLWGSAAGTLTKTINAL